MTNDYFKERQQRMWAYERTLRNFQRQFTNYQWYSNSDTWQRTQQAEDDLAKADQQELSNPNLI
mgnify:CR=1 FL=1